MNIFKIKMDPSPYISIAKETIKFIHDLVDDYTNAIPELKEFIDKCDVFMNIIEKHEQRSLKIKGLEKAVEHIKEAKIKSEEIVKDNSKDKNLLGKAKFNIILLTRAKSYRKYFEEKSDQLSKELSDIRKDLDSIAPEPPVKLPVLAKIFWKDKFQDKKSVLWDDFKEKYMFENDINNDDIEKIRKYLCINSHVTIYAFYSTCSQLGYPIMLPVQQHIDSIRLAELIMTLTKEFYSPEFGPHWVKIRKLEPKLKEGENNEEGRKKYRKELYNKLKDMIKDDNKNWIELNKSRAAVSSLFQRYMMIWRIGKISQDMFDDIDFPGKSRIKIFIFVCETIDEVNYKEDWKLDQPSASGSHKPWEKGKPQVYDFLREILNNK